MNNKKPSAQRREALKKLLAGSSALGAAALIPDKWARPVVDAIVLPAHAQVSRPPQQFGGNPFVAGPGAGLGWRRAVDVLISPAQAQLNGFEPFLCVTVSGTAFSAEYRDGLGQLFNGSGSIPGDTTLSPDPNCTIDGNDPLPNAVNGTGFPLTVGEIVDGGLPIIFFGGTLVVLPAQACSLECGRIIRIIDR